MSKIQDSPKSSVSLGIKQIKVKQASMTEDLSFETEHVQIDYRFNLNVDVPHDTISVSVHIYYWIEKKENMLASIEVDNVFFLEHLSQFDIGDKHLSIPDSILGTILGISTSHTRALLAKHLADSKLSSHLFPIIPIAQLIKQVNEGIA